MALAYFHPIFPHRLFLTWECLPFQMNMKTIRANGAWRPVGVGDPSEESPPSLDVPVCHFPFLPQLIWQTLASEAQETPEVPRCSSSQKASRVTETWRLGMQEAHVFLRPASPRGRRSGHFAGCSIFSCCSYSFCDLPVFRTKSVQTFNSCRQKIRHEFVTWGWRCWRLCDRMAVLCRWHRRSCREIAGTLLPRPDVTWDVGGLDAWGSEGPMKQREVSCRGEVISSSSTWRGFMLRRSDFMAFHRLCEPLDPCLPRDRMALPRLCGYWKIAHMTAGWQLEGEGDPHVS